MVPACIGCVVHVTVKGPHMWCAVVGGKIKNVTSVWWVCALAEGCWECAEVSP